MDYSRFRRSSNIEDGRASPFGSVDPLADHLSEVQTPYQILNNAASAAASPYAQDIDDFVARLKQQHGDQFAIGPREEFGSALERLLGLPNTRTTFR